MLRFWFIFAVCLALPISIGSAQTAEDSLKTLLDCQAIEDEGERLTCFDERAKAASTIDFVSEETAPPTKAASEAEKTSEAREARVPIWARLVPNRREERSEAPNQFTVSITKIIQSKSGLYYFQSEDGLAWRQVEAERTYIPKSLPATATVKKATFGTQFMSFGGRRSTRVKRIKLN
ncbi:MAG: hypothetical protein AAFX02_08350 [Pseudomonadota bacterium]